MKTINLELSKRLAPYLKGVETEYIYFEWKYKAWDNKWYIADELQLIKSKWNKKAIKEQYLEKYDDSKIIYTSTFTLEEAIEFLPVYIDDVNWGWLDEDWEQWSRYSDRIYFSFCKEIRNPEEWIIYKWEIKDFYSSEQLDLVVWKTPIESIEKMLEYLLDNNLLNEWRIK